MGVKGLMVAVYVPMWRTLIIDSEHHGASLAVEERADVSGDGARQMSVEVASTQLELETTRLRANVLASHVVLDATVGSPAIALPASTPTKRQECMVLET